MLTRARRFLGKSKLQIFCALLSAVLIVLAFVPHSLWPLGFIALVPLIVGTLSAESLGQVLVLGVVLSACVIYGAFYWVAYVATTYGGLPWAVSAVVLFAFSLFGESWYLLWVIAFWVLRGRVLGRQAGIGRALGWFVAAPLLWVAIDYAYPKIFPNTFGHLFIARLEIAQAAEWVGAYGLTLLLVITNMAAAGLLIQLGKKHAGRLEPVFSRISAFVPSARASGVVLGVAVLVTFFAFFWGRGRFQEVERAQSGFSRKFRVSLIQGNIGDVEKIASERGYRPAIAFVLGTYRTMSQETVSRFHPDLVVWPETSYPFIYSHLQNAEANHSGTARDAWLLSVVEDLKTPLFFGTYSQIGKKDYNSAFLIGPDRSLIGEYRKSILLAFGEYVPIGPLTGIVQSLIPLIADFGRGGGAQVIDLKGVKLAPQICYEGLYPSHSRDGVALGAEVLLNVTNDSWFGPTAEPWIHLALTRFRAIELRRPIVRSTNTGISGVIDLTGRVSNPTQLFERVASEHEIALPDSKRGEAFPATLVQRWGDWVAGIACVVSAVLFAVWFFPLLAGEVARRRSLRRRSR